MLQETKKIESILFNYETTYNTDFRFGEIREYPKTVYVPKPSVGDRGKPAYRNVHTLTEWKGDLPPFSLLHRPKDVVRTNPNNVQQHFEKPKDIDREHAQKTRPRLVMTPAVSMDDIADERARQILCTDMYTSDMSRGMREAVKPYKNVCAPLPGRPAPSNPMALPKLQPPYVSPEWRMDSVSWDSKQLRAYCDPTKEFWLARDASRRKAHNEVIKTSSREVTNKKN
ncbi:uncharacterized protein LOC123669706 [Melitaea cinxia]|uniref:uncharacterized protein LOC123669706 n=1 Tax=Melitaea cinxia TaxID=113334 RepID=UPI001E273039|nr:uncharacterized protein LOC123669706 [Melitaea cinxia]